MKFPWTLEQVIKAGQAMGFPVWQGEYNLNVWGIRTADDDSNTFNDWIVVFHKRDNGTWAFYPLQATTDPGVYYRENPANVKGTAVLPLGYHKAMWKLGKHQNRYPALVQASTVSVWRDADRDKKLEKGPLDEGWHGINLHRANATRSSAQVDKWSAGCQVVAAPEDLELILTLVRKQSDLLGYATVSYGMMLDSAI